MGIADELKTKRAEFSERLLALSREQVEVQLQMTALDQVIGIYDPEYVPATAQSPRLASRPCKAGTIAPSEIKEMMANVNKR